MVSVSLRACEVVWRARAASGGCWCGLFRSVASAAPRSAGICELIAIDRVEREGANVYAVSAMVVVGLGVRGALLEDLCMRLSDVYCEYCRTHRVRL